jgi:hypothetical protein
MPHHHIPYHLSLLINISENPKSMPHYFIPHHLFLLKNNFKNLENHLASHHIFIKKSISILLIKEPVVDG